MVFYQVFLLSPFSFTETVRGCVSLAKWKSQGKTAEVTVNSKEEKNLDFCLDFGREFGLCASLKITSIRNSIIIIIFFYTVKLNVFELKINILLSRSCLMEEGDMCTVCRA